MSEVRRRAGPPPAPDTGRVGFPRRGLVPHVVDALGRQIVAGEVPPGSALPIEPQLASTFGVSRTVVREAMKMLSAKGLVEGRPMSGTRVRPRSAWHLLDPDLLGWWSGAGGAREILNDLAELRRIVEPPAARMAAERRPPIPLEQLEAAWTTMQASLEDPERFIEADLAFHHAILAATGNVLLEQLLAAIEADLRIAREVQVRVGGGQLPLSGDPLPLHEQVLVAIRQGDGVAAEAAMRDVVQAAALDAERAITTSSGLSR